MANLFANSFFECKYRKNLSEIYHQPRSTNKFINNCLILEEQNSKTNNINHNNSITKGHKILCGQQFLHVPDSSSIFSSRNIAGDVLHLILHIPINILELDILYTHAHYKNVISFRFFFLHFLYIDRRRKEKRN